MRDKLARYAGLNPQPHPSSDEHQRLLSEIEFMLCDGGFDKSKEGRLAMSQSLLRFMVARGFWPLGTQCHVTKRYKVKAKFPRIP